MDESVVSSSNSTSTVDSASSVRPNGAYSSADTRQESILRHWYPSSHLSVDEMAQSGFYAVGDGSGTVTCFACGLRVSCWHRFTDAWTPHALYSPACPHLLELRGPEFVRQVMRSELLRYLLHIRRLHRRRHGPLALTQVFGSSLVMTPAALGDAGHSGAAMMELLAQQLATGALQLHLGQPAAAATALQLLAAAVEAPPTEVRDTRGCSVIVECGGHLWPKALPAFESDSGDGGGSSGGGDPVVSPAMACKICLVARLETVLQPCCHACCCQACLDRLMTTTSSCPTCPVCRAKISSFIKLRLL